VNALIRRGREVGQRYDLKDSKTRIELEERQLTITTPSDMTLEAVTERCCARGHQNGEAVLEDLRIQTASGGATRPSRWLKLRKASARSWQEALETVRDRIKKVTVGTSQGESLWRSTGKNKKANCSRLIQLLRAEDTGAAACSSRGTIVKPAP